MTQQFAQDDKGSQISENQKPAAPESFFCQQEFSPGLNFHVIVRQSITAKSEPFTPKIYEVSDPKPYFHTAAPWY